MAVAAVLAHVVAGSPDVHAGVGVVDRAGVGERSIGLAGVVVAAGRAGRQQSHEEQVERTVHGAVLLPANIHAPAVLC